MIYLKYVKLLAKTAFSSALALGLLLAIVVAVNGGVAGEIDLDIAISPTDSLWFLLATPVIVTSLFIAISPLSFVVFVLMPAKKPTP